MNRFLQGCIIGCVVALTWSQALAQITISSADVAEWYVPGTKATRFFDTTQAKLVNIGDTGSTIWDFRDLLRDSSLTTTAVQPSPNQFPNEFPSATHAVQSELTLAFSYGGGQITAAGTAYEGYRLDTYMVDFGIKGSGLLLGSIPGTVVWTKEPGDTLMKFPLTMGTQWGATDSAITIISVNDPPLITYYDRTAKYESSDNIVDAYGALKLPDSTVQPALRIRRTSRVTGAVIYTFQAKDGAFVQLTSYVPGAPVTGSIQAWNISWGKAITAGYTAIASTELNVPEKYSLEQNYPNPFNPSTVIKYTVGGAGGLGLGASKVKLSVYDILGREVAVLVNESKAPGEYEVRFNASELSSGVYFYRLTAGDFVQTRKMVLAK
jgi:hypothetical protein